MFKYSERHAPTYILPLYQASYRFQHVVNLLIVQDGDNSHYILIKSLTAFLKVKTKHTGADRFTCDFCFRVFSSTLTYLKHIHFCNTGKPDIQMPEDQYLRFRNFRFKMPNPVTIYADFEAYNSKVGEGLTENTKIICEQKPSGFGYTVVSPYPGFSKPTFVYRGSNASDYFVERILDECFEVRTVLKEVKPMDFTTEDEKLYHNSTKCSICHKELNWGADEICRDHCHITGVFRGAAHQFCNIMMQQQKKPIVFFHNAKGYDNHFLIKSLAANSKVGRISVLGQTSEKYSRITTTHFIIQDSMSHLIGSLDSLSSSLRQRGTDGFNLVRKEFPADLQFECCLRKLIYPYDYIDGFERFEEDIPSIDVFYNKLNDEELPEDEYKRLIETCKVFKITKLGELHDLYLKIDVLILACVFEDYRRLGLHMFGLDPAFYVSSPSFSFDAMLHTTGVELELIRDQKMYEFFEKGSCNSVIETSEF